MESWVAKSMSLANQKMCWAIGENEEMLERWVGLKRLEELLKNWPPKQSVLIRGWIKSMDFHSRNPCHPLGIWRSDHWSIVLVIFVPMTYVFLLILSSYLPNLCHLTHIRSYLNSTPICLTHFHSFAYSSVSYLWCAYLISVAIAIRLDHPCN